MREILSRVVRTLKPTRVQVRGATRGADWDEWPGTWSRYFVAANLAFWAVAARAEAGTRLCAMS